MRQLQSGNANFLVKTEREWELLMKFLEEQIVDRVISWGNKYRPTEINNWSDFEERTVVTLEQGKLTYGRIENLAYPTFRYNGDPSLKIFELIS
ncbi:hypothetical protein [Liquorilactobacillus mali]|uniref:Uncharacterized protein n=1 Tax=Liquorilactobacillus mali KCTC 3596 = DSM 20444 TaxID=1046596 RepID=A0A0R2DZI6_9LACO|nr:hypothetical protein [Liquorilactobacillus mali]KRN09359.1 hypothetical protein FD00_GL001082 [Liquorilactobacillus mali KCTC 3596 = DSM 20444]